MIRAHGTARSRNETELPTGRSAKGEQQRRVEAAEAHVVTLRQVVRLLTDPETTSSMD